MFREAESIVPLKEVGAQLLRANLRRTSQAFGTTPGLLGAAKLKVARGRYLTQADIDERAMVAVIGPEVAKELYPYDDPLGDTLRIDDKVLRVIGVLAPVGLSGGAGGALIGRDLNLDVHIPITTAQTAFGDRVFRRTSGQFSSSEVQIAEIYITAPEREQVPPYAEVARRFLETRRAGMTDVGLIVPYELLEAARREALTWNLVLGFIAGIALLVGGIGIMNIMLANVTERTREIGIRRALGATRRHITLQFLVETGVLSTFGGVIGVGMGLGASVVIGRYVENMPTHVAGWSIGLAFAVAAATGVLFGLYPAIKAARQDPIVALRHD
jgi:putative ABC transport system permease protein